MHSATQQNSTVPFGRTRDRRGTVAKALLILIPALVIVAAMGYFAIRLATEEPVEDTTTELSGAELERNLIRTRQAVETYFLQENFEAADSILAAALKKVPNSQDLRLLNAELRMHQGRPGEAYEEMQKAYKIGPDDPEYRYAAAGYAKAAGLIEDAMAEVRKAIAMSDTPDIRFFVFLGALQMQQQRLADAQATLLIALQQDPEQPIIYGMLAEIDLQQGGSEKGLEFARKARDLDPNQYAFRVTEARLLRRLGRLEDSLAVLTAIDEYTRLTNAAVLHDVILTLQALDQKDRAADTAMRAAEASPTDAQIMMMAADAMDAAGRLEKAVDLATRARMLGHPNGQARVEHLQRKLAEASS
ncbi:MAG: tetratricopeptide repeat protein [Phycisphaerales bacterium JB065]